MTSNTANSVARDSTVLDTIKSGKTPHDVALKHNASKPEEGKIATRTTLLLISVLMSMFLVALDRTIISTVCAYSNIRTSHLFKINDHALMDSGQAIPQITDEFNSLPDVGWYGSAYLLTCCSFQLLLGKIYTFYSIKFVLLINVLIFELGSIVCGAAPSSAAFIVGRAISGIGAAGIFVGCVGLQLNPS